jgi:hypothetical protein
MRTASWSSQRAAGSPIGGRDIWLGCRRLPAPVRTVRLSSTRGPSRAPVATSRSTWSVASAQRESRPGSEPDDDHRQRRLIERSNRTHRSASRRHSVTAGIRDPRPSPRSSRRRLYQDPAGPWYKDLLIVPWRPPYAPRQDSGRYAHADGVPAPTALSGTRGQSGNSRVTCRPRRPRPSSQHDHLRGRARPPHGTARCPWPGHAYKG